MKEEEFLKSLEDLTGKVAVVVGGTQGIGRSTTVYLALRGATVYACAPDIERERAGVAEAVKSVEKRKMKSPEPGTIHFHALDLSSVRGTRSSARLLEERLKLSETGRLDILVNNAGIASSMADLSPDGYDKTFAVNCLGHFVFIDTLLDFIKISANAHGYARITITSSSGYKAVSILDYDMFTSSVFAEKRSGLSVMKNAMQRYLNSKLGVLYLAMELDRRLQETKCTNVLVNAVHPGNAAGTNIGNYDQQSMSASSVKKVKRLVFLGHLISHSTDDAAKTQTFVSASSLISEKQVHGEFWAPKISWIPFPGFWMRYKGCGKEELKPKGADKEEWLRFWTFLSDAMIKADGDTAY